MEKAIKNFENDITEWKNYSFFQFLFFLHFKSGGRNFWILYCDDNDCFLK